MIEFEMLMERCFKCEFVDKPFLKYGVYRKWFPMEPKIMMIAESPPPGLKQNFFYNLQISDRLRRNLGRILGQMRDDDLLRWLQSHGAFLTSAIKCRPWMREIKILESMRANCLGILASEIQLFNPEVLISMGAIARRSLEQLNIEPKSIQIKISHPNYLVRFKRDLIPEISKMVMEAIQYASSACCGNSRDSGMNC